MRTSLAALLTSGSLMHGCPIDREAPWYWPVGYHFGSRPILQTYGQYETLINLNGLTPATAYGAHKGLDISGQVDEWVRSPIDGVVDKIFPAGIGSYGSVVLKQGAGWRLSVTHLYEIVPMEGDTIRKGEHLGRVVKWDAKPPDYPHVHLGLFVWADEAKTDRVYIGNPLPYLGGRSDTKPPVLRSIASSSGSFSPAAFVKNLNEANAIAFYAHDALPLGELDILVRAGDYIPDETVPKPIMVAPARLSVRITREPPAANQMTGELVFENAIEFGDISDHPYLEPYPLWELASAGWPDPDFYFIVTHSEIGAGAWDTASAGAGLYRVEVTVEDVAGNIAEEAFLVTVA